MATKGKKKKEKAEEKSTPKRRGRPKGSKNKKPKEKTKKKKPKMKNRIHVISRGEQWAVKREGKKRASGIFESKDEAIAEAERLSAGKLEVVIHRRDASVSKKKKSKVHPYQETIDRLLQSPKRECRFCEVEQYLSVFPQKRNSGDTQKFGHYHGSIFREKEVPGFGRDRWVVSAHILYDWKEEDISGAERILSECISYLNMQSLVSDKTGKPYRKPKWGVIDEKPVAWQEREDVYGEGKGFVTLLSIDMKNSPQFWGSGIDRSQIIKIEQRGRPRSK